MNFFSGLLYNRCSLPLDKNVWPRKYEIDQSNLRACSDNMGFYTCKGVDTICGQPSDFGLTAKDITYDSSSQFQVSSFDNVMSAGLSIFLIFTSDGWNAQMFNLMDVDVPIIGVIFCIITRVFFMFVLFNLLLAIIISAFISLQKQEAAHEYNTHLIDDYKKEYIKELEFYKKTKFLVREVKERKQRNPNEKAQDKKQYF
jgi:hypothetical protein